MNKLTDLIDPGTVAKKIIVTNGMHQKRVSGWIACSIKNKLVELFLYFNDNGNYVSHKGIHYQVNTPLKPLSGVYDVTDLKS